MDWFNVHLSVKISSFISDTFNEYATKVTKVKLSKIKQNQSKFSSGSLNRSPKSI